MGAGPAEQLTLLGVLSLAVVVLWRKCERIDAEKTALTSQVLENVGLIRTLTEAMERLRAEVAALSSRRSAR